MATTRLTQAAVPGRGYAGFIAKTAAVAATEAVTRLSLIAVPGRRYAGFAAKTAATEGQADRVGSYPFLCNIGTLINRR